MNEAWLLPIAACGLSAAGTTLALHYGRRGGLLDQPGQRRSHSVPTPRGGGLGPLLGFMTVVGYAWWPGIALSGPDLAALLGLAAGLGLVAGIGWWDDHVPLPASLRLLVHAAASALLVFALTRWLPAPGGHWVWLGVAAVFLVVAINFCNFLDGINGMAAMQCLICAVGLALLAGSAEVPTLELAAWALALSCLGFLPFNLPRARIFLGDVGSGFLGAALALLLLLAVLQEVAPWYALALLPSAFAIDAGLTLGTRMLRRRHWYRAHREHLYQWLVRSGMSHALVTSLYAAWTASVVALVLWRHDAPEMPFLTAAIYVGAALLWWWAKRGLLQRAAGEVGA